MITRSRGSLSVLAFATAFAVAPKASAQEQPGFASNHIDLSERGSRWFVLDSIDIKGNGRLALGVVNDYSYRSLVDYNASGDANASIVRNQYVMHLGGSIVLADRLRIGVGVPLQLFADGHAATINGVVHRPAEDIAVGDVRISIDGRVLGQPGDAASLALGVALFAPSGSPAAYTSDGKPRVEPRIAFAGRTSSFAYAAKVGVLFRGREESFGTGYIGSSFTGALSGGVLLADGKVLLGPELYGSTVLSDGRAFEARTTPLEALLGAHMDLGENLRLGVAAGAGLTRGYGAPVARGLLSLEWIPGDAKPEVAASTPVADRDGDGILDCADACGFEPGVTSPDPSRNGCPPVRAVEPAPPAPAPLPVPAPVPVDTDRDKDGVSNDVDACPDEPGKADPDPKKNGCPKAFLQDGTIKITDQVKFKTSSAEIVAGKESEDVLGAVLAVLKAHPEIKAIRIEGHTDNTGDAARNKTLSQARAESVAKWLEGHGIDRQRLASQGLGSDKPIDSNDTDVGRTNNRRVEFHVEQGSGR